MNKLILKTFLFIIIASANTGIYSNSFRVLRSLASSRLNRFISSNQFRSTKVKCDHPCLGIKRPNRAYKPSSNGCGPAHFPEFLNDLIPYKDKFKVCCDKHDIDYGTCNKRREDSDRQFLKCIFNKIVDDRLSTVVQSLRLIAAQGYFTAVNIFGCEPWSNAQMNACKCIYRNKSYLPSNYDKYSFI